MQGLRAALTARWRSSTRFQDVMTAVGTFVLGAFFNLLTLTDVQGDFEPVHASEWWHTVLLAAGCAAMLVKRRHPLLALSAGVLVITADTLLGGSIAMIMVIFDLLFSAGLFASARGRAAVMTAVFVTIGTLSVVIGLASRDFRAAVVIGLQLAGLLVIPLWWAANLRQQRELHELTARQAARAERASMARELHDVIASHLSTTAIHSGAALSLPPDTERDRAALREVRTSSLAALEEMRTMIMLLRAEGGQGEAVKPAGLAQLAQHADPDVVLDVPPDLTLPSLVDHTAYRIAYEALTNARKHAPGSQVHVGVSPIGDHVTMTVTNPLTRPSAVAKGPLSAGTGLISMRERAALVGGEVTAGPRDGTWRVEATFPLRGHP